MPAKPELRDEDFLYKESDLARKHLRNFLENPNLPFTEEHRVSLSILKEQTKRIGSVQANEARRAMVILEVGSEEDKKILLKDTMTEFKAKQLGPGRRNDA